MTPAPGRVRQLVDWRAAIIAGVVSGTVLLLLEMVFTARVAGSPWVFVRMLAAVVLGQQVLPPPATFAPGVFAAALALHLLLSVAFACLIAFVLHRGGLVIGIVGGALLGLALYWINFGTVFSLVPWFGALKSMPNMWAHVAFGAIAGGVYELLEVERFVVETPLVAEP